MFPKEKLQKSVGINYNIKKFEFDKYRIRLEIVS